MITSEALRFAVRVSLQYLFKVEQQHLDPIIILAKYRDFAETVRRYLLADDGVDVIESHEGLADGISTHIDLLIDAIVAAYGITRGEVIVRAIRHLFALIPKPDAPKPDP